MTFLICFTYYPLRQVRYYKIYVSVIIILQEVTGNHST